MPWDPSAVPSAPCVRAAIATGPQAPSPSWHRRERRARASARTAAWSGSASFQQFGLLAGHHGSILPLMAQRACSECGFKGNWNGHPTCWSCWAGRPGSGKGSKPYVPGGKSYAAVVANASVTPPWGGRKGRRLALRSAGAQPATPPARSQRAASDADKAQTDLEDKALGPSDVLPGTWLPRACLRPTPH